MISRNQKRLLRSTSNGASKYLQSIYHILFIRDHSHIISHLMRCLTGISITPDSLFPQICLSTLPKFQYYLIDGRLRPQMMLFVLSVCLAWHMDAAERNRSHHQQVVLLFRSESRNTNTSTQSWTDRQLVKII